MSVKPTCIVSEADLIVDESTPSNSSRPISGIPTPPSDISPSDSLKKVQPSSSDVSASNVTAGLIENSKMNFTNTVKSAESVSPLKMSIKLDVHDPSSSKTMLSPDVLEELSSPQACEMDSESSFESNNEEEIDIKDEIAQKTIEKRKILLQVSFPC